MPPVGVHGVDGLHDILIFGGKTFHEPENKVVTIAMSSGIKQHSIFRFKFEEMVAEILLRLQLIIRKRRLEVVKTSGGLIAVCLAKHFPELRSGFFPHRPDDDVIMPSESAPMMCNPAKVQTLSNFFCSSKILAALGSFCLASFSDDSGRT
jgi:hypothetical protein